MTFLDLSALSDSELLKLRRTATHILKGRKVAMPRRVSNTQKLAGMEVGSSLLFPKMPINNLQSYTRLARLKLNDPEAKWSGRSRSTGLRVTRIR